MYAFSSNGVLQWQLWLDGMTPVQLDKEATLVEQGLQVYLPKRFHLDAEQVAQLDSLDPALLNVWATQIAFAIRMEIPITLVKPEQRAATALRDGTKFIESESRVASAILAVDEQEAGEEGDYLRFTISY